MDSSSPVLLLIWKQITPHKTFALWPSTLSRLKWTKYKFWNPLPKVSIWSPCGEVSACRERRRTRRCSRRLLIWCCGRPPSDGAESTHRSRLQNCPFPCHIILLRDKTFSDVGHKRSAVLLFQIWILIGSVGWRNDTGCQWWSSLFSMGQLVWEEFGSLSKTTKL